MPIALDILRILEKEPRQTPQILHEKLDVSLSGIKSTLGNLHELKLVSRQARGLYMISALGKHVLENCKDQNEQTLGITQNI